MVSSTNDLTISTTPNSKIKTSITWYGKRITTNQKITQLGKKQRDYTLLGVAGDVDTLSLHFSLRS